MHALLNVFRRCLNTYSRCPRWATRWIGMCPVCLATLASAPYSSRRLMTAGLPDADASYMMDASSCAWEKTSAPAGQATCQQHAFKTVVCFLLFNPRLVSFSAESNSDSDFPASNGPLSSWSFYHLSSAESAPPLDDLPELLEPAAWGHSGCGGQASLRPPAVPLPSPFCRTVRPRGGADGRGNPPGARWSHAGAAASPSPGGLSVSLQTGRIRQQQTSQRKLWARVWISVSSWYWSLETPCILPTNSGESWLSSWMSGLAPCLRRKEAFSIRPCSTARKSGVWPRSVQHFTESGPEAGKQVSD